MKNVAVMCVVILCGTIAAADDFIDADRPGIADGSKSVKRSAFQIEFGADREHRGEERSLSWPTLLRYGITDNFELRARRGKRTQSAVDRIQRSFLRASKCFPRPHRALVYER